jgi:hypothetical protein
MSSSTDPQETKEPQQTIETRTEYRVMVRYGDEERGLYNALAPMTKELATDLTRQVRETTGSDVRTQQRTVSFSDWEDIR